MLLSAKELLPLKCIMDKEHSSLLVQCIAKIIVNIAVVWFLHQYFSSLFIIQNTVSAILVVGTVFGLLNFILRPVLQLITLPLKLFASILTIIIINGGIILCAIWFLPNLAPYTVQIGQGIMGWSICMLVMGLSNWAITELT